MVAKVEITQGALIPSDIVTDVFSGAPVQKACREAYAFYCGRGDPENRIKEFKLDLCAGRTSFACRFMSSQRC